MKEYPFQFHGQTYHLKGLTDEVKSRFVDYVSSKDYIRLKRQLKDGLIDNEMYEELKADVRATPWESKAVLNELMTIDGGKRFIRLMIVGGENKEVWPDSAIDELADLPEDSSFGLAMEQAKDDAYPKKAKKPHPSTDGAGGTSGEASYSENHSI